MPTLLRTNLIRNPIPTFDLSSWTSGGTMNRVLVNGLWRVEITPAAIYGYALFSAELGKYYAPMLTIKGTPGESVGIATTDNIYGGFADASGHFLPPSGELEIRAATTVGVSGTTCMLGVFVGATNSQFLTKAFVEEVSGTNIAVTGEYFDGDTPNTAYKNYAWTGVPNNSTSLEFSILARRAENYSLADLEKEYYKATIGGNPSGSLSDLKYAFLKLKTGTSGLSLSDMEMIYYKSLSGLASGSIQDHKNVVFAGNEKRYLSNFFN